MMNLNERKRGNVRMSLTFINLDDNTGYLVSNQSLQDYFGADLNPVLNVCFKEPMTYLPPIGFTVLSPEQLLRRPQLYSDPSKLDPLYFLVHNWNTHNDGDLPSWCSDPPKMGDRLRLLFRSDKTTGKISFQFRLNCLPSMPSTEIVIDKNVYLIVKVENYRFLTFFDENELISRQLSVDLANDIHVNNYKNDSSNGPNIPLCCICQEKPVQLFSLPCQHAVICNDCNDRMRLINAKQDGNQSVQNARDFCAMCRNKVVRNRQVVWNDVGYCQLDGCLVLDAISIPCGCVASCFSSAGLLNDYATKGKMMPVCPGCGTSANHFYQIYKP